MSRQAAPKPSQGAVGGQTCVNVWGEFPAAGMAESELRKRPSGRAFQAHWVPPGRAVTACAQNTTQSDRTRSGAGKGRAAPQLCKWAVSQRETDIRIRYAIQVAGPSTERMERPPLETRTTEGAHWARAGGVGNVCMKGRHECESRTWKGL